MMPSSMAKKRILLCGHRSFAAKGLLDLLIREGYQVDCFSRGPIGRDGCVVSGPINEIHKNPYLQNAYDTVVNYILLHQESIERNIKYIHSLIQFCDQHAVKHLIHISSCSVYKNDAKFVNENAPIETRQRDGRVYRWHRNQAAMEFDYWLGFC
jgi:nucleoside-diphosphate-sugar epimerase